MLLAALLSVAHAEPYAMNDAGITLTLPGGWESTRWSDWDFKGHSGDGGVALEVWTTAFQVPVDKESAEAWAGVYAEKLEDMHATSVTRDSVAIEDVAGRPTARTTMKFAFEKGGPKGVMYVAAFAVDGQVVHLSTLAAAPNAGKAASALDAILAKLTVQKAPASLLALGGEATTELGFTATLPDGWRRALPSEEAAVTSLVQGAGIGPKDPTACLRALHPFPTGDAEVVLFCQESAKVGILDDASFADEEALLKARMFGKAADKVPAAEKIELPDRLGFLLAPEINGKDLRIAVIPYDRGTVVGWGIGEPGSGADLGSALKATSRGLTFTGPEAGAAVYDVGEEILHILTYQPWHPAVVGSGVLFVGILAGFGWMVFRRPQPQA